MHNHNIPREFTNSHNKIIISFCPGPTFLFLAQPVPPDHKGATWRDAETAHMRVVPQQLPLDPRPNRRWIQFQINQEGKRLST